MEALTRARVRLRGRFAFENTDTLDLGGTAKVSRKGCLDCRWKIRNSLSKICGALCIFTFLLLLVFQFSRFFGCSACGTIERVLHRSWEHVRHTHVHDSVGCINSAQGHTFITDSEGAICLRRHVQDNGCCGGQPVARLSCAGCVLGCCAVFEYCLSCCLQNKDRERNKNDFSVCLHSCRTSSRSLRRGNRYKFANFPYCFDVNITLRLNTDLLTGQTSPSELQTDIEDVRSTVVVSQPGQNCREACAKISPGVWICHEAYFPLVNNCTMLRNHFACGRCDDNLLGSNQPSFIVDEAPNDLMTLTQHVPTSESWWSWIVESSREPSKLASLCPEACLVNPESDDFDCEAFHPYAQRLCPCTSVSLE